MNYEENIIKVKFQKESWPLKESFRTSNRSLDLSIAETIIVTISKNNFIGRGESTPFLRYGESVENSLFQLEKIKPQVEKGLSRKSLQDAMPPTSARCAIDCALWDLESKITGQRVWELAKIKTEPKPLLSAHSFGISPLSNLARDIAKYKNAPLMKLKATRDKVLDIVKTAHKTSPKTKFIVDFNEGLFPSDVEELSHRLKNYNVALLEQPLHANQDEILNTFEHPIPIGADESCHTAHDVINLKDRYECIIIKPGKCGGLTESLKVKKAAEENNLMTMIVCMFGSSLAVAPAYVIAQGGANFINIEVPLSMAKDREHAIKCENHYIFPPQSELWG
jgi:L-alanine-DL-glutamate epimerase-like enolase superfamily enzyme